MLLDNGIVSNGNIKLIDKAINRCLMEDICMKKLGLIGGMGVESTIPYYHDIVYGVHWKWAL